MAKTPYSDLTSETILAAHISGLQHSINKIEETLNMKVASVTGHVLNPVTDQDDLTLRYRIYEGTIRNWLDNPVPIIKRNGQVVPSSEYVISPEHGVVVFNVQQKNTDQITVDCQYVTKGSKVIDALSLVRSHASGKLKSSEWRCGRLATNIVVAANQPDVFPFIVTETTTYTGIAVKVDTAAGTGARLAIYEDNGAGYPRALLLDAGTVDTTTAGWKEKAINITLEPGLYWLARNTDGGVGLGGFALDMLPPIPYLDIQGTYNNNTGNPNGVVPAYRHPSVTYGPFPNPFPAGAAYLQRSFYAVVWLRKA